MLPALGAGRGGVITLSQEGRVTRRQGGSVPVGTSRRRAQGPCAPFPVFLSLPVDLQGRVSLSSVLLSLGLCNWVTYCFGSQRGEQCEHGLCHLTDPNLLLTM